MRGMRRSSNPINRKYDLAFRVRLVRIELRKFTPHHHADHAIVIDFRLLNFPRIFAIAQHNDAISQLAAAGRLYFEISMQEGVGGLTTLLQHAPLDRVLYGSYFPFFYLESALLKLRESELAQFQLDAIARENAAQLLNSAD